MRRPRRKSSAFPVWSLAPLTIVLLGLVLPACGGKASAPIEAAPSSSPGSATGALVAPPPPPTGDTAPARGGTLRVGLDLAGGQEFYASPDGKAQYRLDPQAEYTGPGFELLRCCLARTLLSFSGQPTEEGGADPKPDLAAELPSVSADGLTWTFRLKPGLHYAPPYEKTEIVAADMIRAVERIFKPIDPGAGERLGRETIGGYGVYYESVIVGASDFAAGKASSISGLEAPDAHTLVVHLTERAGDLGQRFSLPATAPIPPGAADGHDDGYGRHLVASGPYMLESYVPGSRLTLVRNPSWDPASDDLRAAYPDRIEVVAAPDRQAAYAKVESGDLDVVLDTPPPPQLADRYRRDPQLRSRLVGVPLDLIVFAAMNLAQPPFDEVHVRRAANLVVDKARIAALYTAFGMRVATHFAPDSLEGNLLLDYDPYRSDGNHGDLARARDEMARSRYDSDGDGRCDRPECSGIRAFALVRDGDDRLPNGLADELVHDLAQLGLQLDVETFPGNEGYEAIEAQDERYGIVLDAGWAKDFPNGSSWFPPQLADDHPASNISLLGFDADRLSKWGYPVTAVPSVDSEVAECIGLVGGAQSQCWAALDQRVMEQIVPWIPYAQPNDARIVSERVASTSVDQYTNLLALDRIALRPDSG